MIESISTVMTERNDNRGISESQLATTSKGEPNVNIITMPWYQLVGVRVLRCYVQSLLGLLAAASFGVLDAMGMDFTVHGHLSKLWVIMGMALMPAIVSFLQNTLEILTKLDVTQPQMRA